MKRTAVYGLAFGLAVMAVLLGVFYMGEVKVQRTLAGKVLRFHVLANSDSEKDQQLKLKVRDAVGCLMQEKLQHADNLSDCKKIVKENISEIQAQAECVIAKEGYDYKVAVQLEETVFPVKSYGNYTFPAGQYEALRVVIGAGEGHNWWCVMYPNLCFSGTMYEVQEENLRQILDEEEYEHILSEKNYKIRFKYLSFLNDCLDKLTD